MCHCQLTYHKGHKGGTKDTKGNKIFCALFGDFVSFVVFTERLSEK